MAPDNHNPEAIRPLALEYNHIGETLVRNHSNIWHMDFDVPAMHVPVSREGVVP